MDYNLSHEEGNGTIFACQHFDFSIITGYLFIIITVISIIGNIILMWVLLTFKKLNLVTKIFMMNLACSDLIFALTLPFWATYHLKHWIFGDFLCKFIIAMYFTGMYSSIICLTAMSVDRFFIVVLKNWPNNDRRKKTCTICVCVAAWVISIGTSVYDASKVKFYDDYYHCESSHLEGPGYDIQIVLLFFIPFAILIFCHCAIIGTILQATNRSRHRALTIVFFIVVAYIICWGPYNVYLLIESWYQPKTCDAFQQLDIGYNICRLLAFSHCCMNPLLCLLIQKLRNHLFCLLRCRAVDENNRDRAHYLKMSEPVNATSVQLVTLG